MKEPLTGVSSGSEQKKSFEEILYNKFGQYDWPYTHPPMDKRKLFFGEFDNLIKFNNDGHEVWLGNDNEWYCHYKHSEFRKMIYWYLYQYAIVDWFGLRTKIWFFLLHRRVNKNRGFKK